MGRSPRNRDPVDLGGAYVVGRHPSDKPRRVLCHLARSENVWERRTAVVATPHFIGRGEVAETSGIAEEPLGDERATTMPRTFLRYSMEHLDEGQRAHYLGMKGKGKQP